MSTRNSQDHKTDKVEHCERALPFGATSRAAIARFFPASLVSLAGLFIILGIPLTGRVTSSALWVWLWGAKMAMALTAGYLLGLELLRRYFRPVARIDGWRSIVAGLMSPLPFYLVGSLGSPLGWLQALLLMVLGGVVLAVVTFFARLRPTRQ